MYITYAKLYADLPAYDIQKNTNHKELQEKTHTFAK